MVDSRRMSDDYANHRRETASGISYVDVGTGPPTLFVHGLLTNGRLWRNCFRLLADQRRCIAVDLPGQGHTPPIIDHPTVWTWADAVTELIDELGLDQVHLVGNNTGGAVVQVVMAQHTNRIASCVLTNCDTEGNYPPPRFKPAVPASRLHLFRLARPLLQRTLVRRWILSAGYENASAVPDDVVADYFNPVFGSPAATAAMERFLTSCSDDVLADIHDQLAACHVPTLIVWGTGDLLFSPRWSRWLRDLIPGVSKIVEIDHGRLYFVDERADELVDAMRKHWES